MQCDTCMRHLGYVDAASAHRWRHARHPTPKYMCIARSSLMASSSVAQQLGRTAWAMSSIPLRTYEALCLSMIRSPHVWADTVLPCAYTDRMVANVIVSHQARLAGRTCCGGSSAADEHVVRRRMVEARLLGKPVTTSISSPLFAPRTPPGTSWRRTHPDGALKAFARLDA